jgi:hypothetical protein
MFSQFNIDCYAWTKPENTKEYICQKQKLENVYRLLVSGLVGGTSWLYQCREGEMVWNH